MRKISLLDELGFIPYKKESVEEFEKRCEHILSLEDKLRQKFNNRLLDVNDAIKILYK